MAGLADWCGSFGPQVFKDNDVFLRTAVSTEPGGWAQFDYVRMQDYRWGILLADRDPNRVIPAGNDAGKPVWQEVPGEHRNALKRIIVVQVEPLREREVVGLAWQKRASGQRRRDRDADEYPATVFLVVDVDQLPALDS